MPIITDAATVADSAFTNVTSVETLKLGDFTNSVTLGTIAGTAIGSGNTLKIDDTAAVTASSALTVNASSLTRSEERRVGKGCRNGRVPLQKAQITSRGSKAGAPGTDTF